MTQTTIERLTEEEYSALLAYGEPTSTLVQEYYKEEYGVDWISTLASTTHKGMTFGYQDSHCMSTAV